jgi:thymidylate synthase (FAD)
MEGYTLKAEYIDSLGDDITVVNAARVSMDKTSDWEWGPYCDQCGDNHGPYLSDKDVKLIRYLAKYNHFTPFTHCVITLRETVPIFIARQRFKHTVGFTYNEVSRRYVDDTPMFFRPDHWRNRPEGSVKQGSKGVHKRDIEFSLAYEAFLGKVESLYDEMITLGVAPEQARMVLPQSMYTSYYVTGSLHAFARAYKLRSDPHAQKEIQDLAEQWNNIIEPLYPESWKALTE